MRRSRHSWAAVAVVLIAFSGAWADVEPGDVVTPANSEQVRGLIPDELYPYVIENFDGLEMQIVEPGTYPAHPKFVEATVKYACQASVDAQGNLVGYTAGQPFPYSDWAKEATGHRCDLSPDDPQFGIKLAWNVNYRWQFAGFNYPHWGFSYMRNGGKDLWRLGQGEYRRTYFSHRADLLPETHKLEEDTILEWAEFFEVKDPFDLRGTMFLLFRYTDPEKEDDTWAYVRPLLRLRARPDLGVRGGVGAAGPDELRAPLLPDHHGGRRRHPHHGHEATRKAQGVGGLQLRALGSAALRR
jgi:hypothetical protein